MALATFAGGSLPSPAAAAGRLFAAMADKAMVCEIDPTTGAEISSFMTTGEAHSPGLAFDGVDLFYTDETQSVVEVYRPDGTHVRDIPRPPGDQPMEGLGTSGTSLFILTNQTIVAVNPADGAVQTTLDVRLSKAALTYAGSRRTLFVRVGDEKHVSELTLAGTVLNTIPVPENFGGLAFSSARGTLYGIVGGRLFGLDPDTGALLPGYPAQLLDPLGNPVLKTGALAADEVDAQGEICGNCLDDDGDGLVDFDDPACCPAPGALRLVNGRLQAEKSGTGFRMRLQLASAGFSGADPVTLPVALQMRDAAGALACATIDPTRWRKRPHGVFAFRDKSGLVAHGITKATVRVRPNGEVRLAASSPRMTLAGWSGPGVGLTMRVAGRCATTGVELRRRGKGFAFP